MNLKVKSGPMSSAQQRFTAALDALVVDVKQDRSILAAILCGSLSHDVVWDKSDIDLMLVTIDDKKVEPSDIPLYAEGINVHANLVPRAEFRRVIEGAVHNSFVHALVAKGRLLYSHDPSIADLCTRLHEIGERDTELQLLRAATQVLPCIYKARKWLVTREDLDYTALWILYAATPVAEMELITRRMIADREVIPQALRLNPALFTKIYVNLLNEKKTRAKVETALEAVDAYLSDRTASVFKPILDHLREIGEARSSREIEDYFSRHMNVTGVTTACEYLADRQIIGKVSLPVRLTKRSNVDVQELAFYYIHEPSRGQ